MYILDSEYNKYKLKSTFTVNIKSIVWIVKIVVYLIFIKYINTINSISEIIYRRIRELLFIVRNTHTYDSADIILLFTTLLQANRL